MIDRRQEPDVAAFCRAFLAGVAGLDARRLDQLARAADHFLFVNCHVLGNSLGGAAASPLHLSEAALKLTMALESLLGGGDGGHADLSRKMQQRAAVLVGADDEDRLQVCAGAVRFSQHRSHSWREARTRHRGVHRSVAWAGPQSSAVVAPAAAPPTVMRPALMLLPA
ncbi:hypothetical protein ABT150_34370 [Streptomyces mirabilis]|uniref:hypothetical protein n=1 Tax=Streptomyces mirabilis TaxID=68239 RepID=UPI00331A0120